VRHSGDGNFGGVSRAAGDFERAVDAVDWSAE
jgi:hypothetical protein